MEYPLTVKNPLTNQVIVGEVEFFMIDSEEILAKNQPEVVEDQEIGSPVTPKTTIAETPAINSEIRLRKSSTVERLTELRTTEKTYTATYFGSDFNYATQ